MKTILFVILLIPFLGGAAGQHCHGVPSLLPCDVFSVQVINSLAVTKLMTI
jgi:hypothetical protein